MIKSATVAEVKQWLQAGEAVLVDVREPTNMQKVISGVGFIAFGPCGFWQSARLSRQEIGMHADRWAQPYRCGKLTRKNPI